VTRRKPDHFVPTAEARDYLDAWIPWVTAPLTTTTLRQAWSIEERYQIRFWDALLLASANAAGCDYFLSEDLNDGQRYGGVMAINPFLHGPEDVLGRALR
jgi:predicted nucleic acid-binding protein